MPIKCLAVWRQYSTRDRLKCGDGWRSFRARGHTRLPQHISSRDVGWAVLILERLDEEDALALMECPLVVEIRPAVAGVDYPLVEKPRGLKLVEVRRVEEH